VEYFLQISSQVSQTLLTISIGLYSQPDRESLRLSRQAEGLGPFYQGSEEKPDHVEEAASGKGLSQHRYAVGLWFQFS